MLSWRLLALCSIACVLTGALSGWRVTTWAYGYGEAKQIAHRSTALGKGAAAITQFNGDYSHVPTTPCTNQPMPAQLTKLLR